METTLRKRLSRGERGQAVIAIAITAALLVAAIEVMYTTASATLRRIALQNALDAGATAGAAVLADGLNTVAVTNGTLLALGYGAFFSSGATLKYVRQIQRIQDKVVAQTPKAAMATAIAVAMEEGATAVVPYSGTGDRGPSLMVKRAYFLEWLLGHSVPLWLKDNVKTTKLKPYGDRVVMLQGTAAFKGLWGDKTLMLARAGAAATGQRVLASGVFWPLPTPGYHPRLVDLDA